MHATTRRVITATHRKFTSTAIPSKSASRPVSLPPPLYDLTDILHDPDYIKKNLRDRNYPLEPEIIDRIRQLEFDSVRTRKELQSFKEARNTLSKVLSAKQPSQEQKDEAAKIKSSIKSLEPDLARLTESIQDLLANLPNTSHPTSPIGDESAARIVATYGPPISHSTPPLPDPARDHLHLSSPANLNWTDFPSASLVSGASWPYLLREGALLEMALINYSMSKVVKQGFVPVLTPDVVKSEIADRCGFKPRDGEAQQTYFLSDGTPSTTTPPALCLVGTAEIPLIALSAATVTPYASLPLKYVALGRAFRAEAGARGAESRGLYRVHQFSKVEMVVVCGAESSDRILEDLRRIQEAILIPLGLSLRVLDMPTQELGASAHRKYDIEAWMPGRGKWGELSSASNCTSYQSRRLSIRYRPSTTRNELEDIDLPIPAALEATALYPQLSPSSTTTTGQKLLFAHTLNATAAAIPRLIVAILENGAVLDGEGKVLRVRLPEVLRPFWIGEGEEAGKIEWVKEGEALRLEES